MIEEYEEMSLETHHCGVPYPRIDISERAEAEQICAVLNGASCVRERCDRYPFRVTPSTGGTYRGIVEDKGGGCVDRGGACVRGRIDILTSVELQRLEFGLSK